MVQRTNHFQENVKHLRLIHKESQEELAKAIGVKRDRLAKWETSVARTLPIEGYAAIAEHYGVTIERLVFADLTYKDVPRYPESTSELWFAQRILFPIAYSEEAMRIRAFREGHSLLTSVLKEQSHDVFAKLEEAEEHFDKAYKENGNVESACNYVITLLLIAACICNPEICEKALKLVDNPKQVPKFFRKLHLGIIPSHTELTRKLHELFVSEYTKCIDEILDMLKGSPYTDLADYYSALRYLFGFCSNDEDFDTNFEIGSLTLQLLAVKHNPYAHSFITTVEALKRAHADIAGRL